MKRLLLFIAILIFLLIPISLRAAGTVVITDKKVSKDVTEVTFTWIADASAHTVPDTSTTNEYNGYIVLAVINPGSTSPTADYDVDIDNADGADTFGEALEDLSATLSEIRLPKPDGTNFAPCWVSGKLTFQLSGNSVNSANGVVKIYIDKRK